MTFFALNEEQKLLQEICASFIESRLPVAAVRELINRSAQLDREYLDAAAELGFFAVLIPEEHGGGSVSDPVRDVAIIAEQRGRALQPGPFTGANVVAAAIASAGSPAQQQELLPALAAGESFGCWAFGETLRGSADGDDVVVDGSVRANEAGQADLLLVTVSTSGRLRQFVVPAATEGIAITALTTLDLTAGIAEVRFDGARLPASAELGERDAGEAARHQLALAALLTVVDSVGAMERLFELTIEYAKVREAFGRPIGSFQAVKHQLADASMMLHGSKAVAGAATEALAVSHPDAAEVASIAKAFTAEAGLQVGQTCLQVHGGIGYAWEHDLHLYLRRLAGNAELYGDAAHHRRLIAAAHGLGRAA